MASKLQYSHFTLLDYNYQKQLMNEGEYLNQKERMSHVVFDTPRLGAGIWQDMNFKVICVVIMESMLFMALDHN